MFRIEAPFPLLQSTILLPSAELGNSFTPNSTIHSMRSMNGTLYTYVKSKRGRLTHEWRFLVSRDKYLELKEFVERYAAKLVRTIDHEDTVRLGWITLNPIEFTGDGRAADWPGKEAYRVTLQLEENA